MSRVKENLIRKLVRELIKQELDEANSTASVGGSYNTPHAFGGSNKKGKGKGKAGYTGGHDDPTDGTGHFIADDPKLRKESVKEARTINVEPNWEGMWRFFKRMAITNPRDWKKMERTLGSDWLKIDKMAQQKGWKSESVNESDLGLTYKKGKTVKVTHKKSGKELVIIDKPNVKREYEKIGYFAEGQVNEARIVGYDKSYLKNAKKRLKVPHEITKIEYKRTPLRSGVQDKFVRIWFKLKWKPGRWFDPEERWVSVFYDSPERLKMIGKTLKLKLKESVNEDNIKFSKEEMAQLHKDGKVEKGGHTIEFGESINESDLGLTYKKGKTVKVTHKKSGKELVIIDKPNVKREYEKIGYFAEGTVNELQMAPFSSQEAKHHINSDIKDMSKLLGKTSQQVIKIMMDGVRKGKYTAMDISRGVQEGPAQRTHFGEMTFIKSLWTKMREKFRRYSKDRKLS